MDLANTTNGMLSTADMQSAVDKAINESDTLVTALESVAAMYGIPSTNILIDDSIDRIKVINDCVCVPSHIKNVKGNKKAIMRAIGSVLDFISQRINDKLDDYQMNNIEKGRIDDSIRTNANPSKGNVVARYEDDNGDEILVYDTGLVDMANTPEACEKINQLRQDMKIPMYNPETMKKPSYFADEDDITSGVDMSGADASADNDTIDTDNTVDVASDIQESALHLDLMNHFGETDHLGYDLLQEQGFDYVKPMTSIVQEASAKKNNGAVSAEDIKYMKFDNTNILKAIKYFNDARTEQPYAKRGSFDIKKFINSDNYNKAIDCLNKQFNARINIRFFNTGQNQFDIFTTQWKNLRNNLSISKSKGFQLNGLPIDISVVDNSLDEQISEDNSLFGQKITAIFCHEIFHNIAYVLREQTAQSMQSLNMALTLASGQKRAKDRRIIITNYVDALDEFGGKKLNRLSKRMLVKNLVVISAVQQDTNALNELKQTVRDSNGKPADKDIDKLIARYTKIIKKHKPNAKKYVFTGIITAASIIMFFLNPFASALASVGLDSCVFLGIAGIFGMIGAENAMMDSTIASFRKKYKSTKIYEEFYCDMFAGMYKLPITFFIGMNEKYTVPNEIDKDRLNKLAMVEKELFESMMSKYPTPMERNHAGVHIAKKLLEFGEDIDPSIKKYCQWIVDNFSSTLDTDIDETYNQTTFDPKTADDLDTHLQQLIDKNNIVLTESALTWIGDTSSIVMEALDRVNDKGDIVPEKCPICGSKIGVYLRGEPVWLCSNKECNKFFGVLPCNIDK